MRKDALKTSIKRSSKLPDGKKTSYLCKEEEKQEQRGQGTGGGRSSWMERGEGGGGGRYGNKHEDWPNGNKQKLFIQSFL